MRARDWLSWLLVCGSVPAAAMEACSNTPPIVPIVDGGPDAEDDTLSTLSVDAATEAE